MLYVLMNEAGVAVAAYTREQMDADYGKERAHEMRRSDRVQNRNDWKDFAVVQRIAAELTAVTGNLFLPTDAGESVSPRYDVIAAPAVGDPVSYGFNGDYYPAGNIVKVSRAPLCQRVETDGGQVFYRRGNSGSWRYKGMWSMVAGHIKERNPSL